MRGHTYRRGRTWTYVVDIGLDATGRRRQRTKGGFPTKREAQLALHEVITKLQQEAYVEPTRATVAHFLQEDWLPAIRATLRPTTFSSYRMHVRCYLVPALGHIVLPRLTAPTINAFYGELLAGWNGRAPLSPATVRRIHASLHRALRDAVRWQLLARNPAATADPPAVEHAEIEVWSPPQLRTFLTDALGNPRYALWLFYALTGVRRGEALALRWSDLDLDRGKASIRRSLVPVDHQLRFQEPKTAKGRRTIRLDPRLVAALRDHRGRQHTERQLVGPGYHDQDLVFAHPDGSPLRPEQVSRWFSDLARRSGLLPARLHDLRHLHATLALDAGVATRVVSDRLGHSTTAVTADLYQHVLPHLDEEAARRVADQLFGSPADGGESDD